MMSMHIFYLLNLGLPPENCKAIFGVGLSAPAATFYSAASAAIPQAFPDGGFQPDKIFKSRNHSSSFTISSNPF
jgi:hypothetical protein